MLDHWHRTTQGTTMQFVSAGDVIKFAIQQEDAAASYYESTAVSVKDVEIKKIFQALASEEAKHKKCLTDFELGKNPELDSITYTITDYKDEPKNIPFKPNSSKIELLDYAINTEKESEYLYTSLAKAAEKNEGLYKLFMMLATIENQHVSKLASLYNHQFFKN
jgi:rubrerythrin